MRVSPRHRGHRRCPWTESASFCALATYLLAFTVFSVVTHADHPTVSYIFPAGAQRGTEVQVKVGGHFLHGACPFEMLGPGVEASKRIVETDTIFFEGPLIFMPASQQKEDYPKDHLATVKVSPDAALGLRYWQVWTSQGAVPARPFVIGELPEIVEVEIDGDPVSTHVDTPVTINGRIHPREDVDVWTFDAQVGKLYTCAIDAGRIGSPLDPSIEIIDPDGHPVADNAGAHQTDSAISFIARVDGEYRVRIHDVGFRGLQHFVYRLTIASGPRVDWTYPLGGRRGEKVKVEYGDRRHVAMDVAEIELPADAGRDFQYQIARDGRRSNPFLLQVSNLPEHHESEPNDTPASALAVETPVIANGRIGNPGDVDFWSIVARQGDVFAFDVRAARLGSPLDAVLTVQDAAGKDIVQAESAGSDVSLRFTPPAAGRYVVRVKERFQSRGGPSFAYRLEMVRQELPVTALPLPRFRLFFGGTALTVHREGEAKLQVSTERDANFSGSGAIRLVVDGLPDGVSAAETSIPEDKSNVELKFRADKLAEIATHRIRVRGIVDVVSSGAREGALQVVRTATQRVRRGEVPLDSVLLAVALRTPFKVIGEYYFDFQNRGGVHHRKFRLERGGFDGPLTIKLADRQIRHLQGVTGPTIQVPPESDEFTYPVYLPPWMEVGRTCRVVLMAIGDLKEPDGSVHKVSYSSHVASDQIVLRVDSEQLGLDADESVRLGPGSSVNVKVAVKRGPNIDLPVKVELVRAAHIDGLEATPITVAPGVANATLTLRCAESAGPFNLPLVIRGTAVTTAGDRIVGETLVDAVWASE